LQEVTSVVNVVSDPPVSATGGLSVTMPEGGGAAVRLATFTDPGGPENPLRDYSADIDWGDGTPMGAGEILRNGATLEVFGRHAAATPIRTRRARLSRSRRSCITTRWRPKR